MTRKYSDEYYRGWEEWHKNPKTGEICMHYRYTVLGDSDDEGVYIWQTRRCNDCGKKWMRNYKMGKSHNRGYLRKKEKENLK